MVEALGFRNVNQTRKSRRVKVKEGEHCVFVLTPASKPWRGSLPTGARPVRQRWMVVTRMRLGCWDATGDP